LLETPKLFLGSQGLVGTADGYVVVDTVQQLPVHWLP